MYFCPLLKTSQGKRSLKGKKSRCSSVVEYILGKDGVTSSTLVNGSLFFYRSNTNFKI